MIYSKGSISTIEDCDLLIAEAQRVKKNHEFRLTEIQHRQDNLAIDSEEFEDELKNVDLEIAADEMKLAQMEESPEKNEVMTHLSKCQWRKRFLNDRKNEVGAVALLRKENDLANIQLLLTESIAYIAALTERRTELEAEGS